MTSYSESIKNGIRLINRNWQLVAIQFALSVISCIAVLALVGIPLFIAVIAMGIDVSELTQVKELFSTMQSPFDLLEKYMGLGLVILTSLFMYMVFAFSTWVYAFGGSMGVIGRAFIDKDYRFRLRDFFHSARHLFMPIVGYTSLLGAILVSVVFVFGLMGGLAAYLVSTIDSPTLGVFLSVFISLLFLLFLVVFVFFAMAFTLFGSAVIYFEGTGAIETMKRTYAIFRDKPMSLGLYGTILTIYIVIFFITTMLSIPINLIPILGTLILFPFQLFLYGLRGYMNLAIMASVFHLYYQEEVLPNIPVETTEEISETTSSDSTTPADTSSPEELEQAPAQPQTDESFPGQTQT